MGFRRRANASIKVFDPIKQCGSGFRKSDDHVSYNGRRIEFAVDDLVHSPREAADRFSEQDSEGAQQATNLIFDLDARAN